MRALATLLAAIALSLLIYAGTFIFLIKKPLTIGFIEHALELKRSYAAAHPGPKLVIVAGSNGLYSHRCEVMEPIIGMPCVNGSITAELQIGYILEFARRLARPGDTVLMPLEYGLYEVSAADIRQGLLHPYRVSYDRATLLRFPLRELAEAVFQFDLPYLAGALAEMGLDAAGVQRGLNVDVMTPQGDLRDQTAEKGELYRDAIQREEFRLPHAGDFRISAAVRGELSAFFDWARENRIGVIGTLPTTFDDRPVGDAIVQRIAEFYRSQGEKFVALPNRSQYPRSCFFNTQFHLIERCQIAHSEAVAGLVAPLLDHPRR
jgi:hypothetical protein